ncbi:MAG: isomerizing glutamine--fructose-6-phosphate transaminase, partial [Ignavibacteria bacterium]|nr:isomerizing glutamine--fructose-6-phosphate transaminase [Ignavibacteria bacterium]
MCGIVGYIGDKNAIPILIQGLKRLEYRGYDSAGLGFFSDGKLNIVKNKGKVSLLEEKINGNTHQSHIGIGHTRWATHGIPNETNAHPHFNKEKTLLVIHNGIIENYQPLKKILIGDGYEFKSETDTEVLVHLIDSFLKKGVTLFSAVRHALNEVEGTYGLAVLSSSEPDKIVAARKGSPLVLGIGENENFIASDVSALIAHTKQVVYLEDGEIAEVYKDHFRTKNIEDEEIQKEIIEVTMSIEQIDKGGYSTFMLKEIMEQPDSVLNSMRGRLVHDDGTSKLGGLESVLNRIANSKRFIICACGTS